MCPLWVFLSDGSRSHMVEPQHMLSVGLCARCGGCVRAYACLLWISTRPCGCVSGLSWYRAAAKQKYKSGKYMQIALVYKWGKMHILAVFGVF